MFECFNKMLMAIILAPVALSNKKWTSALSQSLPIGSRLRRLKLASACSEIWLRTRKGYQCRWRNYILGLTSTELYLGTWHITWFTWNRTRLQCENSHSYNWFEQARYISCYCTGTKWEGNWTFRWVKELHPISH